MTCSSSSPESITKSKRTRVVNAQSRNGCVTCKVRRVKCDEHKPICRRCVRAGRLCGGFVFSPGSTLTLCKSVCEVVAVTQDAQRFAHLATLVLSLDKHGQPLQDTSMWGQTFLQMSATIPCVKAAATAFGAAYESLLLNDLPEYNSISLVHYRSALQQLQSDLIDPEISADSLAMASLILACVEILSQQQENALAHFFGVRQLLDLKKPTRADRELAVFERIRQELVVVDIQVASYMVQAPSIEQREVKGVLSPPFKVNTVEEFINASISTLHRVYHYIGRVGIARYDTMHTACPDRGQMSEQSMIVSELSTIQDALTNFIASLDADSSKSATIHPNSVAELSAFRAQLAAAQVFVLAIYKPLESAYDRYLALFRNIISYATASLRYKRRVRVDVFSRFSPRPGILGPLFLVTMKCREPSVRHQAIAMLQGQGREGPADGQIMAAIGRRLAEIEEASVPAKATIVNACDVQEQYRVHGYALESAITRFHGHRTIQVLFTKPNPPMAKALPDTDYAREENWEFWSEKLTI